MRQFDAAHRAERQQATHRVEAVLTKAESAKRPSAKKARKAEARRLRELNSRELRQLAEHSPDPAQRAHAAKSAAAEALKGYGADAAQEAALATLMHRPRYADAVTAHLRSLLTSPDPRERETAWQLLRKMELEA